MTRPPEYAQLALACLSLAHERRCDGTNAIDTIADAERYLAFVTDESISATRDTVADFVGCDVK